MQASPPLKTIGQALTHFHWLPWGMALLAGALAFGATLVRHPTYEATATLTLYEANDTSQGFDLALQADQYLTQRFIALATSRPVLEQVCATEGGPCDPVVLSKRVQATTPRATGQISITASGSSPSRAARLANDVANELVGRNRAEVDAAMSPQRTYLRNQLASIEGSINAIQGQIQHIQNAVGTDASIANGLAPLLSKLNLLQGQYANTFAKLQDLDVVAAQRAATLSLYEPAVAPSRPSDPDPVRYVGVGVVGGLIVGFLLALLAERFRDRIEDGTELADATGCSIVLDLGGRVDPTTTGPYGFLAQASLPARQRNGRSLLLVAASVEDRLDGVAETLARAAAHVYHRILIIRADGPVNAQARGELSTDDASNPGGSARPASRGEDRGVPMKPEVSWGGVMVAARPGMTGANGSGSWNQDGFDLIIHCALPPMADPSMGWARPAGDSAILVATRGSTRFSEAGQTAAHLRHLGVQTVGAILLPRRTLRSRLRWGLDGGSRKQWDGARSVPAATAGAVAGTASATPGGAAGTDSVTADDVAAESRLTSRSRPGGDPE